jgi:hypothetical protein
LHLIFFNHQNVTKVNIDPPDRPNCARLSQNLKKKEEWRSIEVHAVCSLFFVLGCSVEGLEVLRKFLKAEDELMFNPASEPRPRLVESFLDS